MASSIGILGCTGRMGRAIAKVAEAAGVVVAGGIDRDGLVEGPYPDLTALAHASSVLIDFTAPAALAFHLDAAVATGTPILIGTTGLLDVQQHAINRAAERIAIVQTYNTSLGINVLRGLVEQAARILGPEWDIEIVEMHHRHKLDTPSGTALLLGASAANGRGGELTDLSRFDRMQVGPHAREEGGIYYASLRGGSVAGEHQAIFAADGERIELGHRAENRGIFAKGALRGALWLEGRPAGRYTMADVLGFAR